MPLPELELDALPACGGSFGRSTSRIIRYAYEVLLDESHCSLKGLTWGSASSKLGRQLDDYRTAISKLLEFNKLNDFPSQIFLEGDCEKELVDAIGPAFSPGFAKTVDPVFSSAFGTAAVTFFPPVTFVETLKFFTKSAALSDFRSVIGGKNLLLGWVQIQSVVSDLLKQLRDRKTALEQIYWVFYCFCGVSWSRRIWFLLHGSHPPKPEPRLVYSPVFGCV